ncbi:MAG TPA: PA2779 family protein, partial [Rudaea sp.]|nr:PA2779 family protein [Rudaea sp.]
MRCGRFASGGGTNIGIPVALGNAMKQSVFVTRALIALCAAGMMFQASLARAAMIGPEAALPAPSQVEQDRAKVQAFLERANVKERMQAMGVSGV